MKRALLLTLFLVSVMSASALQFTSPSQGATYTAPATVQFTWDQENATFILNNAEYPINGTNTTLNLSAGNYTAQINNTNETANVTFTVTAPAPTQTITVTTDKPLYEVGTAARIAVTVATPGQLNLTVLRNNVIADTYVITVQQQTEFLYTLLSIGNYAVSVTGQGASATTSFTVQNTSLGVSIVGSSTATAGRLASFSAQVTGGTAPYTYFWQFSDNTTSTGQTAEHVFSTNGTYTVTILAQDATNKQASANKTITVQEQTYTLDVTVMGQQNKLLKDAVVVLTSASGSRTDKTDRFGESRFKNLSANNYTLNVTYNDTVNGITTQYKKNLTLVIDNDEDQTVILDVPYNPPTPATTTTTTPASTPASTSTATPTTPTTTQITPTQVASTPVQQEPTPTSAAPKSEATVVSEEQLAFEKYRSQKLEELRAIQSSMARSDEKQKVLETLELDAEYGVAQRTIEQAANEQEITKAIAGIPKEVTVLTKDTSIITSSSQSLDDAIDEYLTQSKLDENEQKKHRFNIEETMKETTITAKKSAVRVVRYSGESQYYTIFTRDITAPQGATFYEVIPQDAAKTPNELFVDGSHEVISNNVLHFLTPTYSYYVTKEVYEANPVVLPVPQAMQEPPSMIGFVAIKLKLNSFDRGGLYIAIIGAIFGIALVGNVYLRKNSSSTAPAFLDLANLAVDSISEGKYAEVAKYLPEIESIHKTLNEKDRAQTKDVIIYLQGVAAVHEFRTSIKHLHSVLALNDAVGISTAYERASQQYAKLTPEHQAKEKTALEAAHAALEEHLTHAEAAHS